MPFLYKSFCYPTGADVGAVRASEGATVVPGGVVSVSSVSVSGGTMTTTWKLTATSGAVTTFESTETIASCSTVGPYPNHSGMTVGDTVELGGMVITAWVAAYGVAVLRRAIGW